MPFLHGKGTSVYANGYNMSQYLSSIEAPSTVDTAETTTLDKESKTYIAGKQDATLTAEGLYDGDIGAVDEALNDAIGVDYSEWSYYFGGDTAGNRGYGLAVSQTEYNVNSTIDDAVRITVSGQSSVIKESLISITPLVTVSASGSTASVDNGASSANGGSAYLHAIDVTGTVSIKLEQSANDSTWSDLVTFTDVSADHVSERVEFTGTVERYVRATYTLDGGETLQFQVGIHRN